ncbi:MAG: hypothetical protein AAF993_01525 [Pseudomonadota bacterium]
MDVKWRLRTMHCILCAALGAFASLAHADHGEPGELEAFVSGLYGGNGLFLPPATGIPQQIADAHVPHFTGPEQIAQLSALSTGVISATGVFALNSTVTGITFDLSAGAPVQVEDSLGPLLAERAKTIGKGRLSFGLAYSSQEYDELDGDDLDEIQITLIHQDCCAVGPPPIPPPDGQRTGFEEDTIILDIDLNIKQEVWALTTNYGITDNWDIGLVVPIVTLEAEAFSEATIVLANAGSTFNGNPVHSFGADPNARFSSTGGEETGLGDVILRTKYNFSGDNAGWDLAVLGQVTFATGDEEDLLGTGETKFKGMFIASKQYGWFSPHINLAYEAATSRNELENYSYAVGFDARLTPTFTGGIDIIGRNNPHVDEIGNNIVDIAFSAKWNPFRNRNAPLTAFVSLPLNDDGLRSDVFWGVGIDFILN